MTSPVLHWKIWIELQCKYFFRIRLYCIVNSLLGNSLLLLAFRDDSDVLKRYQEKKIALQTARKRKRVAEREVDEIREQLRIADTKVAVEAKKVHFLEEELEELKEYLEDSNV